MTRRQILRLAILLVPLGCGAIEWPFFAMDTAVRDVANLHGARSNGYAGVSWRLAEPSILRGTLESIDNAGLSCVAVYSYQYADLQASNLVCASAVESALPVLAGSGTILWLPISSKAFPQRDPAGDAVAVPALRALADRAAVHGVRIALYPHMGCWVERVQDAVRVANAVDRPNLGVTFNLCHALMAGDEAYIPARIAEAGPRLFLVTINGADRDAKGSSWSRLIRPLDEGTYDVRTVLDALERAGYRGPIGLQGYAVPLPPTENLRRSAAAWSALMRR